MIEQITDYSTLDDNRGNKILFDFFRASEDFMAVLNGFNPQFEELENTAFQLFTDVWLDTAKGVNLDLLGKLLGLSRLGRDDESYRTLLKLKVDVNVGSGTPELLIGAIRVLYDATTVNYIPDYPAKVEIEQNGELGLFFINNLETNAGNNLVTLSGDNLTVREIDTTAAQILDNIMPSGVLLTITNI